MGKIIECPCCKGHAEYLDIPETSPITHILCTGCEIEHLKEIREIQKIHNVGKTQAYMMLPGLDIGTETFFVPKKGEPYGG